MREPTIYELLQELITKVDNLTNAVEEIKSLSYARTGYMRIKDDTEEYQPWKHQVWCTTNTLAPNNGGKEPEC